jgi:hypothetical protein
LAATPIGTWTLIWSWLSTSMTVTLTSPPVITGAAPALGTAIPAARMPVLKEL